MKTVISPALNSLSKDEAEDQRMLIDLLSMSRGKKPKGHRSIFLSAMMKSLGGDEGNAVAEAFVGKDETKFREEMAKIVDKVVAKMPK